MLATFYHFNASPKATKGAFPKILIKDIQEFPIIVVPKSDQQPVVDIVSKILSITKTEGYLQNPIKQAQVEEYEKQIDQLVYKLYGLTEEEIATVEEQTGVKDTNKPMLKSTPSTEPIEQPTIS
jgi:restriction endonuclease S subunit